MAMRKLRIPANRITEIMNGQRDITGDTRASSRGAEKARESDDPQLA